MRVVDVGAQRVERHLSVGVPLGTGDLGAAEASGNLNLDAARAGSHGPHDGLFHGATESDALLQLVDDVLRDETGVQLGMLDLHHVDLNVLAGELFEVLANVFDADAAFADNDARLGGVDDHARLVGAAFDLDLADRGRPHPLVEELTDGDVFVQPIDVVLFLEPAAVPRARDAQAQSDRMNLLTHVTSSLPLRSW